MKNLIHSLSMKVVFRFVPVALLLLCVHEVKAAPAPASTTTLSTSSASVTTGTAMTLMATVTAAGSPVNPGLVTFCDASVTYCEGPAVLGTAQLSAAGTASVKVVFGLGNHSVKAVFARTVSAQASVSAASTFTVTGAAPTNTTITSSGSAGNYSLTATVGFHGLITPGANEQATFVDTTNSNRSLGTATLGSFTTPAYNFITIATSPVAVGNFPASDVVADFNSDGILDLAVANASDNTVSVFVGDGKGGFTAMPDSPFSVGAHPVALAVADLNNDGHPDILSVNSTAGNVSILLATGSGSFAFSGSVTVGNGPQAIAVGDFNTDGNADIVVANLLDSTLSVLLGTGSGSFAAATTITAYTNNNPNSIAVGDFNADGLLDIAIANLSDSSVSVLTGDGTGAFTSMAGSPFTVSANPRSVTVGDFNADGKSDLAVISETSNNVAVLINTGAGFTGATGSPFATGVNPSAIVVGDFNGDGKQDLAITNSDDSTATILLGDGTGVMTPAPGSPLPDFNSPAALALGDFNGDGTLDLAVTNLGVNSVSIRPLQITLTGTATLSSVVVPGGGTHLVDASYAGDPQYGASTSANVSLTGSAITTATTLAVSPATMVQYMQTMQLTAMVNPYNNSNYIASGNVTFSDGATQIGQSALSNGQALLSIANLAVGSHRLSASYAGDTNFTTSSSVATTVTVVKATTTTTLTASSTSITPGANVTFTATVKASTSGVPTGTVNFFDGATQIGSGTLSNGVATYSTTTLSTGTHTISAVYIGDNNYTTSTSANVTETASDFTVVASPSYQTVIPGRSAGYQITVSPLNGSFGGVVTFTATGLPPGASVAFSPSAVTPGTAAASTVMTVTAGAQAASLEGTKRTARFAFALLLLPLMALRRFRRSLRPVGIFMVLLAGLAGAAGLAGCSNGSGYFSQAPQNYTITVTATSGAVSHTTSVTLNVQ